VRRALFGSAFFIVLSVGCSHVPWTGESTEAPLQQLARLGCPTDRMMSAGSITPVLDRLAGTFVLKVAHSRFPEISVDDEHIVLGHRTEDLNPPHKAARDFPSPEGAKLVGWSAPPQSLRLTPAYLIQERLILDRGRILTPDGPMILSHTWPATLTITFISSDRFAGTWVQPYDYIRPVDSAGNTIDQAEGVFCAIRVTGPS
jgi:hypothetical protein